MDFDLPDEDDPRRQEIRQWFEENKNPTYQQIADRGLSAPNWPAPYGLGADPELQYIVEEEFQRAGVKSPLSFNPIAVNQCGQSLLTYGTDAQREELLPPALSCEHIWCMLFSEPSGGSDLAGLRTTAVRDGDDYILNGQKTWNSAANFAKIGVVIARTDSTVPKHKGLSQFIINMDTPGVTVRPIHDMTGEVPEYNEVFLDNVRVPASRLLGKEGEGWRITMQQLQSERASMTKPGAVWGAGPTARELIHGLIESGKIEKPLWRDEAAKLFIEGELLRLLVYRGMSAKMNGRPAGIEGNIGKMVASPHGQNLSDLAKQTQGAAGLIKNDDVLPLPDKNYGMFSNWDYSFWFGPASTLGVGTQEILKNSVAEHILGLPRDVDPTAKIPFAQRNAARENVTG